MEWGWGLGERGSLSLYLPVSKMMVRLKESLVIPHVNTIHLYILITKLLYNLTTLCLNGTLPCVDFMDIYNGRMI